MNFVYARNMMQNILSYITEANGFNNTVTAVIEGIRHPDNLRESEKGFVCMWELEEWNDYSTAGNLKYVNFRFRVVIVGGTDETVFSSQLDDFENVIYNSIRNASLNPEGILKAARINYNRPLTSPEMYGTENFVCESEVILTFIKALRP